MPSVWIEERQNKHGKNHVVRWEVMIDGQSVRGSESCGPNKRFAKARADEILEDLYSGQSPKPKIQIIGMAEFAKECLSNSQKTKSKNTHRNFDTPAVNHFAKWFGNKLLGMIKTEDLFKWRDALIDEGYGPNTVRMRLRALSAALGYAKERGYLTENPFDRLQRKSSLFPPAKDAYRYLTVEEVEKLLRALPIQQAKAVYFILCTGLRHGEFLSLDWKNVHQAKNGKWTAEVFAKKTGTSRTVELDQNAIDVMGEPKTEGKVFQGETTTWLGKAIRTATDALKMGAVRVHDLRHTWATNFMYRFCNIFDLMARGGWTSIQSASVYQHLRKREDPCEYPPFPHYFPTKTRSAAA